jgi:hypothetical protein
LSNIKLPESAADEPVKVPGDEAYITNPCPDKNMLTKLEAIDIINRLSGILLADGHYRSQEKHKVYLRT